MPYLETPRPFAVFLRLRCFDLAFIMVFFHIFVTLISEILVFLQSIFDGFLVIPQAFIKISLQLVFDALSVSSFFKLHLLTNY